MPEFFQIFRRLEKSPKIKVECAKDTIASAKHPGINEDTILVDEEHRVYAVCDGLGGLKKPKEASEMACKYISQNIARITDGMEIESAKGIMSEIMKEADNAIFEESKKPENNDDWFVEITEKKKGMGTTASVFKVHIDDKGKAWGIIGHIGDSRIYKIQQDGTFEQLTVDDDALKEDAKKLGDNLKPITENLSKFKSLDELSEVEKKYFIKRHEMLACLGVGEVSPEIKSIPIEKGDRFVIMTDGVHKNSQKHTMEEAVKKAATLRRAVFNLIWGAIAFSEKEDEARAEPDDMSAIMIEIQ